MGIAIVRPLVYPDRITTMSSGLVVASGRTDDRTWAITGKCWPLSNPERVLTGIPVAFFRGKPKRGNDLAYNRWLLAFKLTESGTYVLQVAGRSAGDADEVKERQFRLMTAGDGDGGDDGPAALAISITSHSNNDDITAEADDFMPYGVLTDYPLGTVTMTDAYNNVIGPLHTFDDYQDLQYWTAQFPPLGSGVYTLQARDVTGDSVATITGLTVQ